MASFRELNIASKANAGIEIPVIIPGGDKGVQTGELLTVLSTYSERFRKAEADGYRRIREYVRDAEAKNKTMDDKIYEEVALDSIAQLIIDWTYDEPCTTENVKLFLQTNPHMYDTVNRVAADHSVFFANAAIS